MRLFFQRLAFEKHGEYIGATKQTTMVETTKLTDYELTETLKSLWDKATSPTKKVRSCYATWKWRAYLGSCLMSVSTAAATSVLREFSVGASFPSLLHLK
jgi:hypothetical protein